MLHRNGWLVVALGAFAVVLFIAPMIGMVLGMGSAVPLPHAFSWGPGMMWGYGQAPFMEQGGWGLGLGMGVGLLLHLGFWGAVIVGGAVLVRSLLRKSHRTRGADDSAVGILGRRYAAGELTKEEYEQRLHVLAPR